MLKKIHVIINPASGQEQPILTMLNKALHGSGIEWDVSVTHKKNDAKKIADKAVQKEVDVVVVYGGDGTVVEVAQALFKKKTPMAILPGGTANIIARELGIPTDIKEAIELLKSEKATVKQIDMGVLNSKPFLIRINFGALADMTVKTKRKSKDSFGKLAYGVSAVKQFSSPQMVAYNMILDGKKIKEKGYSLMIANSGNIGISDMALVPDISISDGYLDIILIKESDLFSLLKIIGSSAANVFPKDSIKRWKAKEIIIKTPPQQTIVCDDHVIKNKELKITIEAKAVNILLPHEDNSK